MKKLKQISKQFYDDPKNLVNESIDGMIKTSGGALKRLDGFDKAIRVVVRSDYQESVKNANKVALITGGGSGHEPAHCGFIGKGMLTAVACGDIFASPTIDAVLAAIKTVTGPAGCLLIIKNYTGDRLNFGFAAQKAKSLFGLKVKAVIVGDDTALPHSDHPRGVAGTVFVHRFAGKLAEAGKSLEEIYEAATEFERGIVSVGASLSTCNLPGLERNKRLDGNIYELGLGIHGEPGAQQLKMENATKILKRMVKILMNGLAAREINLNEHKCSLLVNNFGAVPPIEMTFLAGKALQTLGQSKVCVTHVQIGHLMTALDMNGFSLSLVAYPFHEENPLLGDVGPSAWTPVQPVNALYQEEDKKDADYLIPVDLPEEEKFTGPKLEKKVLNGIRAAMQVIIQMEPQLTKWDQKSGDGDCGLTFKKGARAILKDYMNYPSDPVQLCMAISRTISHSMGGSSGVLLAMFFSSAASAIKESDGKDPIKVGFTGGVKSMVHYGGAKIGSRTMVDALLPAMQKGENLQEYAKLALEGAESTKLMAKATHGRSQYLTGTNLKGIPDPGAMAVAFILLNIAENL